MLLHRSQDSEAALVPLIVVVVDVVLNHRHEFLATAETLTVISLSLEYPPEPFHRAVVDALGYSGHALRHANSLKFVMKRPVGVLVSSVTVAKRRCSGVSSYGLIERVKDKRVVIAVTDHIRDYSPVVEIKDRTEIYFVLVIVLVIPLELSDICKPFLIWLVCCELSVQDVFCDELRIFCLARTSLVRILDRGLDVSCPADPECSLVIDSDVVFAVQIIVDPAVSLGRILHVDLFHLFSYEQVLSDSFTDIATQPLVIC